MPRPHDCRYRTRVAKHTPPVTGRGSGQSSVETKEHQYSNAKKTTRYSSAAFKSTSWELKRQSSEKFLCVAGVGLVHTLGGPGRHEDFSPRFYFTVPLRCILGGPHPTLKILNLSANPTIGANLQIVSFGYVLSPV